MSNIPSANSKIQIEATQYLKPTSESLMQTMGGSINYALDQVAANASAISAETSARISADSTINGKTVFRPSATGGSGAFIDTSFGSTSSFITPGDIIDEETYSLSIPTSIDPSGLVVLAFKCQRLETSYLESGIYVDFVNDPNYGTQRLFPQILNVGTYLSGGFTEPGHITSGGNMSIIMPRDWWASPTSTIRVRLRALGASIGRFNRWEYRFSYYTLDRRTIGA